MPLLLAPVGYGRIFHPHGEVGVGTRRARRGRSATCSPRSPATAVEEVARAAGPLWYQLYLAGGQSVAEARLRAPGRPGAACSR